MKYVPLLLLTVFYASLVAMDAASTFMSLIIGWTWGIWTTVLITDLSTMRGITVTPQQQGANDRQE